jgi:uncharacterized ferritin-like protein (DUF455 family)
LPKVGPIAIKIALGRHQHADIVTAAKLERSYRAMTRLTGLGSLVVPRSYRTLMREIDASASDTEVVRRIYLEIKLILAKRYAELIEKADRTLDAHLLEVLQPALAEAERQIEWARSQLRGIRGRVNVARSKRVIDSRAGRTGLPRDQWLWRPLDRVPRCVRVSPLLRARGGRIEHRLTDAPGSKGAVAELFHHLTGTELATMELYARCCYEHPDMPEEFHQDYARITSDEARHGELAFGQARKLGLPWGSLRIDASTYEQNYEYATCPPGSRRELLWRLLLQGTFQESLIIEGFAMQAKKMRFGGFEASARIADAIVEQEVSHVASALKWTRYLCGGDHDRLYVERATARNYEFQLTMAQRRAHVAEHPDEAIAEVERYQAYAKQARKTFPFSLEVHVNRTARRAAGFTEREIEQIIDWGHVKP